MITLKIKNAFAVVALLTLVACSQEPSTTEPAAQDNAVDSSPVLALVNGQTITQDDVDFMIRRTFSGAEQLFFDDKMQAKVLDSLIASMAMKQKMQSSLGQDSLDDIHNRANAFKEELFVKEYLVQHATPVPVSTTMVKDYYEQYPEEFGGGESRVFEMLSTSKTPSESNRDAIIKLTQAIQDNDNWAAFGASNTVGLNHKKATMRPGLFNASIEGTVKNTLLKQASNVIFVKGVPHFIRVLEVKALAPKPLNQVSGQIRKKLAALQLKKAVKNASATAIADADVVRN